MSGPRNDLRALAVLVAGACIIGFSPILVRLAETGPAAAGFWRLAFAAPILWLMAARSADGAGRPSPLTALAALFFALDLGFWHYGIKYTSVANATVLSNGAPITVVAFAWIFLRQRPGGLFLAALAGAIAGAVVMALAKSGGAPVNQPLGDALSLSTALWYGLYVLATAQARKTESTGRVMLWATLLGAPLMALAALLLGEDFTPATWAGWAACVGLGVMHATGQGAVAWSLGRLPTATASVVMLIQPVVAAGLGWVLFGEHITPLQGLGAVVLLAGVVLAQWAGRKESLS